VLLDGPRLLDLAGTTVAVIRRQPEGGGWPDQIAGAGVVVFGGTHVPTVDTVDGVLYINPGSPSLAQELTVGVLELGADGPTARIVPFERPG
jgi:predicted phosphodiesterase